MNYIQQSFIWPSCKFKFFHDALMVQYKYWAFSLISAIINCIAIYWFKLKKIVKNFVIVSLNRWSCSVSEITNRNFKFGTSPFGRQVEWNANKMQHFHGYGQGQPTVSKFSRKKISQTKFSRKKFSRKKFSPKKFYRQNSSRKKFSKKILERWGPKGRGISLIGATRRGQWGGVLIFF